MPAEILGVLTRRDGSRKRDRTSPELPRLNKDIQKRICEHKRKKLRDFVENMDHKTDITKQVCYVDDLTVWATGANIPDKEDSLNSYLE